MVLLMFVSFFLFMRILFMGVGVGIMIMRCVIVNCMLIGLLAGYLGCGSYTSSTRQAHQKHRKADKNSQSRESV
jgi:hypothetical protein